jgi:hypothetical protein
MIIIGPGVSPTEALRRALALQGVKRRDLYFESDDVRMSFEAEFGCER